MKSSEDARLIATREQALDSALNLLMGKGVLAVTYVAVSKDTGISRSTLYRHWPKIEQLRNDAFKRVATPAEIAPHSNGPLRADLKWMLSILLSALNETPWGKIAPQVIAAAATDDEARKVINDFMKDRMANVGAVFMAAQARGEIPQNAPVQYLIDMCIAVPYFRKLIAGAKIDHDWLESHVDLICTLAEQPVNKL